MKKAILFILIVFMLNDLTLCFEERAAVATLTEIEGQVEIRKNDAWETLFPLQPLYPGDVIRVSRRGKAVLMYLGASMETITEVNSPCIIKQKEIGQSRMHKGLQKLKEIMTGLVQRDEKKTALLVSRQIRDRLKILQPPKDSFVLFPKDYIDFKWELAKPPFIIRIFRETDDNEREKVFEKELNDIELRVPGEIFHENTTYSWIVFTEHREEIGWMHFLKREESQAILSEFSELLAQIPEENQVTRYLANYGFYVDKGLYYDAHSLYSQIQQKYPENQTFKRIKGFY
jgi:hypothetical protein